MLSERWSLETFPYAKQPGVNRKQIRAFAALDFVAKRENLVLIGPAGVCKTGLARGILPRALLNGLRREFIRRAGSVRCRLRWLIAPRDGW